MGLYSGVLCVPIWVRKSPSGVIAAEIVEDLEAALAEFAEIASALETEERIEDG